MTEGNACGATPRMLEIVWKSVITWPVFWPVFFYVYDRDEMVKEVEKTFAPEQTAEIVGLLPDVPDYI